MLEKVEQKIGSITSSEFIENTLLALFALFIATAIHELGHVLFAYVVGCPAGIAHVGMITGKTAVSETCTNSQLALIALGGALTAFVVGLIIWFFEEESKIRYLSVILMFFSSSLQLIPLPPLDGYQAIQFGLNPVVEILLFLLTYSVFANILIKSISK
jgi:Zn-dependent protease